MQCSENSDSYQKAAAYNIFENISMHVPKRSLKYSPKKNFHGPYYLYWITVSYNITNQTILGKY